MKIALEVKNSKSIVNPSKNSVILYDGKQWYVTTKEDIFAEYEALMDKKIAQIERLINKLAGENAEFKQDVSRDILKINEIVKRMYEKGE